MDEYYTNMKLNHNLKLMKMVSLAESKTLIYHWIFITNKIK